MLTRFKVNGFKNLADVDVSFGPFTCIAGANGVGKSNLFDAITFLGALADKPLAEAAAAVRGDRGRAGDVRNLFERTARGTALEMSLETEMIIPRTGTDDLGQEASARSTCLRYRLVIGLADGGLVIRNEELEAIPPREARLALRFPHSRPWESSIIFGDGKTPRLIWTEATQGGAIINLRQRLGQPLPLQAGRLKATALSTATSALNPTVALARSEMARWTLFQLEPSALRSPDSFVSPRRIAANGAHVPGTLKRIIESAGSDAEVAAKYARIANRLSGLIEGIRSVQLHVDSGRELLTLMMEDRQGVEHEARSLSDGTLRFLALAVLESDDQSGGVFCIEEPENGIHPERVPAMLRLLQDIAVEPALPVDAGNPLRQVIVNTHSPIIAAQVPEDSLLVGIRRSVRRDGDLVSHPVFRWLPETWRARAFPEVPPVALGQILAYLDPVQRPHETDSPTRVIDRDDIQSWLPFSTSDKP